MKRFDKSKKPLKRASAYMTKALLAESKGNHDLAKMFLQAAFGVKFKNGIYN